MKYIRYSYASHADGVMDAPRRTDEVEIICPRMGFVFKRRIGTEPNPGPRGLGFGRISRNQQRQNRIPANRNFLEFGQKHNHREIVSPVQLEVVCWGDSL